jgi:hypothetical protein
VARRRPTPSTVRATDPKSRFAAACVTTVSAAARHEA